MTDFETFHDECMQFANDLSRACSTYTFDDLATKPIHVHIVLNDKHDACDHVIMQYNVNGIDMQVNTHYKGIACERGNNQMIVYLPDSTVEYINLFFLTNYYTRKDLIIMNSLDVTLKAFYTVSYPSDDLGPELDDTSTFKDLRDALNNHIDVYSLFGTACDSLVRERLFKHLANVLDLTYDDIYDLWIEG